MNIQQCIHIYKLDNIKIQITIHIINPKFSSVFVFFELFWSVSDTTIFSVLVSELSCILDSELLLPNFFHPWMLERECTMFNDVISKMTSSTFFRGH
eukprot:UN06182